MPFVPMTPDESREWAVCDSPLHYPPVQITFTETIKWVCPKCGTVKIVPANLVWCPSGEADVVPLTPAPRAAADVLAARARNGCCERYADRKACDCLAEVGCAVCMNPDCDNPGGKH